MVLWDKGAERAHNPQVQKIKLVREETGMAESRPSGQNKGYVCLKKGQEKKCTDSKTCIGILRRELGTPPHCIGMGSE